MSLEGQSLDYKSLLAVTGKTADWGELAKDCVAFANAQGGRLLIGIEDGETEPPAAQIIPAGLLEQIQRRISEITVNIVLAVQTQKSPTSGGEYIEVIISRSAAPASTSDGRYFLRVADTSKPLVGEEVQRLLNERSAQPWETLTTLGISRRDVDSAKLKKFTDAIRASARVKNSVKEKSDAELLDHYCLAMDSLLTNLGILCVGRAQDRARLGVAPVIQLIKFDADNHKVNKLSWDDHQLTPMELLEAVWQETPDFRETYELPEGLFRQQVPAYDARVIRELLVNALVHRPYSQRGDIYINLYPDRLQMVNPGLLPLGVTPRNILHQSVRRNSELARVFHDLGLMEREGSGFDLMYEVLTSQGRSVPLVVEGSDRVEVTVSRRLIKAEVIDFIARVDQTFQLSQRARITLGILVQSEGMTARQLADVLELPDTNTVIAWVQPLVDAGVVSQTGRTKGTRYFVDPAILRTTEFPTKTTLSRIESPRLQALILEDLKRHPGSAFGELHQRIGKEIPISQVRRQLQAMLDESRIRAEGENRWRRYWQA
jgi:ATP-dependent DNA helicase RecG